MGTDKLQINDKVFASELMGGDREEVHFSFEATEENRAMLLQIISETRNSVLYFYTEGKRIKQEAYLKHIAAPKDGVIATVWRKTAAPIFE